MMAELRIVKRNYILFKKLSTQIVKFQVVVPSHTDNYSVHLSYLLRNSFIIHQRVISLSFSNPSEAEISALIKCNMKMAASKTSWRVTVNTKISSEDQQ